MAPLLTSPAALGTGHSTAIGPILLATRGLDDADAAVHMAWQLARRTHADVRMPTALDDLAEESVARLAASAEASVIVLGRGGHGRLARSLVADTALDLLGRTDVPVYAVDPRASGPARRVLVAVDFSPYNLAAARVALALAAPDAAVALAHVRPGVPGPMVAFADWARSYDRASRALFDRMAEALAAPAGVQLEAVTLSGQPPARSIVDFAVAWRADLLVCSTHGHGSSTRPVPGGVAAELIRTAPCSILCVPATMRARSDAARVSENR